MTEKNSNAATQVFLVGGGPGDPELLTVKALRIMQSSDVIVHDYLISDDIIELCNQNAEFISVGKKAGNHSLPQQEINQLLVDLAKQDKIVCRLKGGDPYIFGRGGEEALLLKQNNIPYQVVPGITAAAACSASSGIPLTHRDYAQSIQFITGHFKADVIPTGVDGVGSVDGVNTTSIVDEKDAHKIPAKVQGHNWQALACANQTLVVYMGIIRSSTVKAKLIEHGRSPNTPVAIIEKGTRPDQRVVVGKLEELDTLADEHKIGSPALIIIGEVVDLHHQLF